MLRNYSFFQLVLRLLDMHTQDYKRLLIMHRKIERKFPLPECIKRTEFDSVMSVCQFVLLPETILQDNRDLPTEHVINVHKRSP